MPELDNNIPANEPEPKSTIVKEGTKPIPKVEPVPPAPDDEPDDGDVVEPSELLDDDFDEPEAPTPTEPANKYVYDNLTPINVRVKLANGQVKTMSIKVADELPDDFEFISKKEEKVFDQRLADQATKADKLFTKYEAEQQKAQYDAWETQENNQVLREMVDLQTTGALPKFKYRENDARFNDDPAVKEVNEILKYRDEINNGFRENNQLYRLPLTHAVKLYRADHPKDTPKPTATQERQKVAARVATASGTTARPSSNARPYRPGMSLQQIAMNEARLAGIN